jgi:hypothetical protein
MFVAVNARRICRRFLLRLSKCASGRSQQCLHANKEHKDSYKTDKQDGRKNKNDAIFHGPDHSLLK